MQKIITLLEERTQSETREWGQMKEDGRLSQKKIKNWADTLETKKSSLSSRKTVIWDS